MIEPQNTMMPLAADSAPVDLPQGEEGFGAMLAQTLGMVPRLDPNAVQQIAGQSGEGDQDPADLASDSNPEPTDKRQRAYLGGYPTIPTTGEVAAVATPTGERPPIIDGRSVDPGNVTGQPLGPAAPPKAAVIREPETIPQPPAPTQVSIEDGVGEPSPTADAPRVIGDSLPEQPQPVAPRGDGVPRGSESTPISATPPEVNPSGDFDPVDPMVQPRPEPPPSAAVTPPAHSDPVAAPARTVPAVPVTADPAQPIAVDRPPTAAKPFRGIPVRPDPAADLPVEAAPTVVTPTVSLRDAASAATTHVRMSDGPVQVAADRAVPLREPTATVEGTRPIPQSMPNHVIAAEGAPQPTAPSTPVTAPAAPIQHSALAERVMQAVELQANQPPPRTMVVDIPEIEGLRLVVSVRSGAEVHVVPASASTATDGVQPFLEELQGVLENRGFVMTGDDRRRNGRRQDQDETTPSRPARPTFRRAERTDNDLRI